MNNSADNVVGMMDGAYFTGRKELLVFFNSLLQLNLSKIEETASGAIACQLVEYIYPGSVPMKRVNWQARNDYEYVQNYKLLQAAFDKHRIQKHIDVDRLIRAKYQDNLEFCQWLKAFFDQAASSLQREDYDPVAVRSRGKGGKATTVGRGKQQSVTSSASMPRKLIATGTARRVKVASNPIPRKSSKSDVPFSSPPPKSNKETVPSSGYKSEAKKKPKSSLMATPRREVDDSVVADAKLMKVNADLMSRNSELELMLSESEGERDFYFDKLRSIELLMEAYEKKKKGQQLDENNDVHLDVVQSLILDIAQSLYAPEEDQIPLDDKILTKVVEVDNNELAVVRPGNDVDISDISQRETNIQSAITESSSDILQREMMQTESDEEEPLMETTIIDDNDPVDEL